jgi:CHAT domain-containing protein
LLAAGTEEEHDGVLEVHEVYNLDLSNTALVVLSACETRLGERSAGDEIVGLNRAFIYAGTPSVVASLWSVEDEATMELMVAFYDYLENQGYTKGEALRQAQIDALQNPDTAHPYYWAGFVLTGDAGESGPGPTETPTPSGEDDSGGGFCPGAALPLTLAAIVGTLVTVRKSRR